MTWTLDATAIRNHEGHKLCDAAYRKVRGCSMKVSEEEKREALALMVQAPEYWHALHQIRKQLDTIDEREETWTARSETIRNIDAILRRLAL